MRQAVETARVQLEQAQQNLDAPAGAVGAAAHDARSARAGRERRRGRRVGAAGAREAGRTRRRAASSRSAPALESARYDLSKVRIESPIDGIVTRRNIQEGETAVIGTMNNAGTVLLTLADMSVIQAEVEVDETNIPHVSARTAGEDHHRRAARPDLQGPRHRDRQQPDSGGRPAPTARRRRRPTSRWWSCSTRQCPTCGPASPARPTSRPRRARASSRCRFRRSRSASWSTTRTARSSSEPRDRQAARRRPSRPSPSAAELKPGQTRKETEGVFVVRDGRAEFVPIKMGIAGDRYFEVLSRPEGRRPGHHRSVQLGARHGRRRPGEGRDNAAPRGQVGRVGPSQAG